MNKQHLLIWGDNNNRFFVDAVHGADRITLATVVTQIDAETIARQISGWTRREDGRPFPIHLGRNTQ
jgi:hypothetical protein